MKKNIVYLILLLLLGGIAYWAFSKKTNVYKNYSIAIKDTSDIGKIFLADKKGNKITIEKTNKNWIINKGVPARQDAINNVFELLTLIKPNQPVKQASYNTIIKMLSTYGVKVELYNLDNKLIESFTAGGVSDNSGLYVFKEGTDVPFIHTRTAFQGDLSINFFTDLDQWKSRSFIQMPADSISEIKVQYYDHKDSSFTASQGNNTYTLANNAINQNYSKQKVKQYLNNFADIKCLGYENNASTKDSVLRTYRPYGLVQIQPKNGPIDSLHLFYLPVNKRSRNKDNNQYIEYDKDYLYVYNHHDLMIVPTNTLAKMLTNPAWFAK